MQITKEMVEALAWLRTHWTEGNTEYAIEAFNVLDNAGVFAPIDELTGYSTEDELAADALLNARLQAGLDQVNRGETHDLGDFSHYLTDDVDPERELGLDTPETSP